MKSQVNFNREINKSLLTSLLYPIKWTPAPSNDVPDLDDEEDDYREPVRQYYHKFSLEVMTLDDVYQYLENRCTHSNVYFPARDHHDFKELVESIKNMVKREDLPAGKELVHFEGAGSNENIGKSNG